ncbi:hypothetical protein BD779DRAFT_1510683 [Infundibulicybe gibba]|nr:hypothetical protein BD779DRAFT_1510683 [Infundibulicybe gibba]
MFQKNPATVERVGGSSNMAESPNNCSSSHLDYPLSPPFPFNPQPSRISSGTRPLTQTFEEIRYKPGSHIMIDSETGVELTKHVDLWFGDGSVICRAENTLFRVHISMLSRHSECFRDMFSIPQPQPSNIHSDAGDLQTTPVVHLHDSAEDVGNLFSALYDGPKFGSNDEQDFRIVSGILRLSTKYIFESLRTMALAHLSVAWPATLKAWDLREDRARTFEVEQDISMPSNRMFLYPHPIAVINLAREVHAPSLLPAAFYDLARWSYSQIFDEEAPTSHRLPPVPSLNLAAPDLQRLCLGKEAAQHAITSLIQAMGNTQYSRPVQHHSAMSHMRRSSALGVCVSAAACRKDFSELVDLATQHYLFDRERGSSDPLYVADELGQLKSAEFSECKACAKSLESWAARERERLWKLIPSWFRLEPLERAMSNADCENEPDD